MTPLVTLDAERRKTTVRQHQRQSSKSGAYLVIGAQFRHALAHKVQDGQFRRPDRKALGKMETVVFVSTGTIDTEQMDPLAKHTDDRLANHLGRIRSTTHR